MYNTKSASEADYKAIAVELGVELASIKAIAEVESLPNSNGFIASEEGTAVPVVLYERHKMYAFLKEKGINPDDYPSDIVNRSAGGYTRSGEHRRLQRAVKIDRESALKSCSWGRFQIMGFNFKALGYRTVQDFVNDMYTSEATQLVAFAKFIKASPPLLKALREKDWANVARYYNGPAYKKNNYDVKLKNAYTKHSKA